MSIRVSGIRSRFLILVALGCVGLSLVLVMALHRPAPLAPVTLLSPSQLPAHRAPLFARLVPATPRWAWAWRLKEKVLGRPRPVTLDAVVIGFTEMSGLAWSNLSPSTPAINASKGPQVWVIGASELGALRRQLKQAPGAEFLLPCTAITADGVDVSMYHGSSVPVNGASASVGLSLDFFPRIHGQVTDLAASITYSEVVTNQPSEPAQMTVETISIRTNLCVAARFQLTNGSGVFLLQSGDRAKDRRPLALLLSATLPVAKK